MRSAFPRPDKDFAAILDSLEKNALRDAFRPVAGVEFLWRDEAAADVFGAAAVANRYAEWQGDAGAPPRPRADTENPDFATIAAEIARMRSPDALRALRRALARATHPDRVPLDRRAQADQLMAKVNAAIDLALSGL